jgi:sugar phosphate isomerase/epimerase
MKSTTRRSFIKKTSIATAGIPFLTMPQNLWAFGKTTNQLSVSIFSKHLQFLDYRAVGEKTAEIGFDGVDLTVRPGGHVLPENVKTDLPIAVEEIKKGGSNCFMMSTAVDDATDPVDIAVLETASKVGIKYYRANWFKFPEDVPMEETLNVDTQKITALSVLNETLNIAGCYQNHAGKYVGSSIWEVKQLLKYSNPAYFGSQYDIRHALVEGGLSWENGLKLIHKNINTIVLKDFKWEKVNGVWEVVDTPIGEGMVNFNAYFKLLKKYEINVPASLHIEYPLGGDDYESLSTSAKENLVYEAMKHDLTAVRKFWSEA